VAADAGLDELLEGFGEWAVTSHNGALPARRDDFARRHHVLVERRALNLESIFPHLVAEERAR
jgi:hypothetical protein